MLKLLIGPCDLFTSHVLKVSKNFCRSRSKMENVRKVFVRHVKDEDLMKVSFVYGDPILPDREFNFLRSKKEQLETALKRMRFKVEGAMLNTMQKKKKKKKDLTYENNQVAALSFYVTRDGHKVEGDSPNIEAWSQGSKLVINDVLYDIIENAPMVSYINLPKNIMAGFPVYPRICLEFSEMEDSIFMWYRCITKSEKAEYSEDGITVNKKGAYFAKVGEGFIYETSSADVNHRLRVVCSPRLACRSGKEEEAISLNPVICGPTRCPFEERHHHTKVVTEAGCIRCISYNILADLYADSDTARNQLFPHCPPEFLEFEYRKQLYLKEIIGYNGDLLCLQEVDKKVFQNDLVPVLSAAGLEGVYCGKGKAVAEGLSCFYRTSKFKLVHNEVVILSEIVCSNPLFQDIWGKITENEFLKQRILSRTTALQAVLLECVDFPNKRILLGNTHLFFHPDSDNIRLIQASVCIRFLEHLKKGLEEQDSSTVALLLSGDFNSCPEFGVLRFVTTGHLSADCVDWQSNSEEAVPGLSLQHTLSLDSACGFPQYTNYTQGFNGCLDYIFYDKNCFSVKEIVPVPTHEEVTEYIALPNKMFPSDHLALVCTLGWL